ncbi:tetratricopeptide repeat protein [Streptomyces sp. ID01-12c]|uniref:Tetratricopeptide repeat protein n=1 Tax=Streptomyces caniscabiei TaxID=2746961 RepID=A0A927QJ87_9ACTN|nr:LuxR C-terminal-related transcriptional regulator [Streptomyces caniscabiei]MBD9701492.1 tetratricopeptide repeat protein [Streptomyces caniscabiei]MBD9723687.1 tetratricopeptide repeat protein [Streptomyces caniscabiei]MDX3511177.1 LuxR C-terminal-related transcriptional regulator [Streptomyces caniscabiei]MDX3721257.1 LuxR C-terminal-related transcriptional regulator [Streptomyces caniscabiei]MDX3725468.1 LuxR C-terminal-related transcriptional regulator [Streptomyces caniscabiei]
MTSIVGGSESRRTSGFPAELTSFVGRRDEAADVRRLLSAGRLLTLTGPGGVGKTRLAGHVAGQVARAFPDGVWLVPLAALSDEAFVPHAVNDALGVRNETVRPPLEILVDHLRERRLLIVLDNCEHLLRSCAVLAGTVLAATEGVRILATSRHRLGLAGEQLFEVPPLPAPAPEELSPSTGSSAVESFPALRLFADRAAAVVPGFTVGEANQQAVARLCRRLDGLPLAIELAAVRVRALGVDQLVERLDDRYQLLTCGSPTSAPRHRTLRSAVDWSHELCTPQEQLVWAWLSVFVGGFDLAAAEAVCAGEDAGTGERIAPCAVLDAVAGLVDKSVLVREEHGGHVRYRLLVSLRDYGLEKLHALDAATETRRRHRDHFARLGAEYEQAWFGPDQTEITARIRIDQDNFRAALDFCLTTPGEAQHGLRLAAGLWFHWVAGGIWGEGRHWMDGALRAGARPDVALTRAMWAGALTSLVHSRSAAVLAGLDPVRAAADADEELPVPAPPPVPAGALAPGRARASTAFVVLTRVELACTLVSRGRADEAIPLCAEAVALCEAHGEQWARSWALRTLALAHWSAGQYDRAAEHARACLRLPYTVSQHQSLARTLDLLAAAEALAGDAERAGVLRGAVDRIWHDIGGNPMDDHRPGRPRAAEHHARRALGDHAYALAHRRGGRLTAEQAVAYALGEPPAGPASAARTGGRRDGPARAPRTDDGRDGPGAVARTGEVSAVRRTARNSSSGPREGSLTAGGPGRAPASTKAPAPAPVVDPVPLTRRELQVAALVAQGRTNKQIADHLVIARRTAEGHVERILVKLGFHNRSQVAAWFSARAGL